MATRLRKGPAQEADPAKQLKVKLGVLKRMLKEVESYEKEAKAQEAKIQKMRDEGKDFYDIRKQEEVLQESYMMIPDSKNRMIKSREDLQAMLDELGEGDEAVMESEAFTEAKALLAKLEEGEQEEPLNQQETSA